MLWEQIKGASDARKASWRKGYGLREESKDAEEVAQFGNAGKAIPQGRNGKVKAWM